MTEKFFRQKTLKKEISLQGIGLFTGSDVVLTLKPASENHGIIFHRTDLEDEVKIPAKLDFVKETPRCTILGSESASIWTVEHLLSALHAYGIDNLDIYVNGPEVPVCDGSAKYFAEMIEKSGLVELDGHKKIIRFSEPLYWSESEILIVALPSDEYRVTYLLHYPQIEILKSQYFSLCIDNISYKNEIAPCRTFSVYEEIEPLLKKGFIKGGGLNNAVIIKENKIFNPDGLRFAEEMARHKILDLIGDFSLLGAKIFGHIIAIRSGHYSNISFAKKIEKIQ